MCMFFQGIPKTLTPTTDRVHGLPTDRSTDHPQNRIKIQNKDFTYCFSNRSLVSAKFRALSWENVTNLGSVTGASILITDHYIIAIFFAVALHERPRSLRNLCYLSLRHFVRPTLSRVRELVPAFTLPLSSHGVAVMDER